MKSKVDVEVFGKTFFKMSRLKVDDAKKADEDLKYLVFGYIQLIQKTSKKINIIPLEIFYLCILFLFEPEYFVIIGDGIRLSEDEKTITKGILTTVGWRNTSYAKNVIPSISGRFVTWKVKIGQFEEDSTCIGITSSVDCVDKDFAFDHKGYYYALSDRGCGFRNRLDTESTDLIEVMVQHINQEI